MAKIDSSIESGGSGAVVVFWTTVVHAPELLPLGSFFYSFEG